MGTHSLSSVYVAVDEQSNNTWYTQKKDLTTSKKLEQVLNYNLVFIEDSEVVLARPDNRMPFTEFKEWK